MKKKEITINGFKTFIFHVVLSKRETQQATVSKHVLCCSDTIVHTLLFVVVVLTCEVQSNIDAYVINRSFFFNCFIPPLSRTLYLALITIIPQAQYKTQRACETQNTKMTTQNKIDFLPVLINIKLLSMLLFSLSTARQKLAVLTSFQCYDSFM